MALGDNDISVTAVRNESQQGDNNYVSGLDTGTQVNAYSFWSPRGVTFDPLDSYILKPVTDTSPFKLGDFRRYNHAALTPVMRDTASTNYALDPGSTGTYVPVWFDNYEFNFKRADPNNLIVKFGIRYFTTLADAQANTNPIQLVDSSFTVFQNITFNNRIIRSSYTPSPALSGHSVTQTTIPDSSSILVNFNTTMFPTTGLTTTPVTRYLRLDFYDAGNNIKGRLLNNITSFTIRMKANPSIAWNTITPIPSGFTAVLVDTYVMSDATQAMSINDTILRARIRVKGIQGATNDYVSGTVSLKYWDGTTETTMTGYQNVAFTKSDGTTYSLAITWTLPSGITWSYDSVHTIRLTFNTAAY